MKNKKTIIRSYEDLEVYKKLCLLHLEVTEISLKFPNYELYEIGSQIRRSSNAAPANIAEGWNNQHINIYLEGINRSMGEIQETLHHLAMAFHKKHLPEKKYLEIRHKYQECASMLRGLQKSLITWRAKKQ